MAQRQSWGFCWCHDVSTTAVYMSDNQPARPKQLQHTSSRCAGWVAVCGQLSAVLDTALYRLAAVRPKQQISNNLYLHVLYPCVCVCSYVSFVEILSTKAVAGFQEAGYGAAQARRYACFSFFAGLMATWLLGKLVSLIASAAGAWRKHRVSMASCSRRSCGCAGWQVHAPELAHARRIVSCAQLEDAPAQHSTAQHSWSRAPVDPQTDRFAPAHAHRP